jgi:hypothetical protein
VASDAELVAVGIGHDSPTKATDLMVLDLGTTQLDDLRCGFVDVSDAGIEMKAPSSGRGLVDMLKGNRVAAGALSSKPNEPRHPMSDLDSQ